MAFYGKLYKTNKNQPFGHVAWIISLLSHAFLPGSLGCWIPHHQSDSWHPHGVCLILGNEGNGAFSDFVLRLLGGSGLPYFHSSYPYCFCWWCSLVFTLPSSPPALTHSLSPPYAHASHPSIPCSCHCVASPHPKGVDNVMFIDGVPCF